MNSDCAWSKEPTWCCKCGIGKCPKHFVYVPATKRVEGYCTGCFKRHFAE